MDRQENKGIRMRHLGRKKPNSNLFITEMAKEDFANLPEWKEESSNSFLTNQIKLIKLGKEKVWWKSWLYDNAIHQSYWTLEYAYWCPKSSQIEVQRRAVEFVK